jgi:hypothetical protein
MPHLLKLYAALTALLGFRLGESDADLVLSISTPPHPKPTMMTNDGGEWWWRMMVANDGGEWWWRMMVANDGGEWWWRMVVANGGGEWWWRMMVVANDEMMKWWNDCWWLIENK